MVEAGAWESFPLKDLVKQVEAARDAGKYLIIQDKSGNVGTFFRYKGIELPFAP